MSLFNRVVTEALSMDPLKKKAESKTELLERFKKIAKAMSLPGWTVIAKIGPSTDPIIEGTRRDGARFFTFMDWKSRDSADKKIQISGDYLRGPGGHLYGIGYGVNTPKINVTMKADVGLSDTKVTKAFAIRFSTALKKRFLPFYIPLWEKGVAEKNADDAHASTQTSTLDAVASAFPKLKKYGDQRLYADNVDVEVYGNKVTVKVRDLTLDKAREIVQIAMKR